MKKHDSWVKGIHRSHVSGRRQRKRRNKNLKDALVEEAKRLEKKYVKAVRES